MKKRAGLVVTFSFLLHSNVYCPGKKDTDLCMLSHYGASCHNGICHQTGFNGQFKQKNNYKTQNKSKKKYLKG